MFDSNLASPIPPPGVAVEAIRRSDELIRTLVESTYDGVAKHRVPEPDTVFCEKPDTLGLLLRKVREAPDEPRGPAAPRGGGG